MASNNIRKMSASTSRGRESARLSNWQEVLRNAVEDDSEEFLDRFEAAFLYAVDSGDVEFQVTISASTLAFMLLDWSRFDSWQAWITRFDKALVSCPRSDHVDAALSCAAATGRMASALLRGESPETLALCGARAQSALEELPKTEATTIQVALTASVLMPWLQMSRNVAYAQALHARVILACQQEASRDSTVHLLLGTWLGAWAQHLHFVDQVRFPEALRDLDSYLVQTMHRTLQFKRDRLFTEQALFLGRVEDTDRGLRAMLAVLRPQRPMQRAIYNSMAATAAMKRDDLNTASLHFDHMQCDLMDADCPPVISSTYQLKAGGVYLAKGECKRAADVYAQCAAHANPAHASIMLGFAALAHALQVENHSDSHNPEERDAMRRHLLDGLAAMRRVPNPSFFFSVPHARSAICALALREQIEVDFVASALKLMPVQPPDWADENWPWAMSLRCLGRFSNSAKLAEGQVASKATSRPLNLLMLIAAHGKQGVSVHVAMDCLWPEQDGAQAEHSLTMTLVRLRRLFVDDDLIERDHGWLRLSATKVWTDVRAFESVLDAIAIAETTITEARRRQHVVRLFELYRGDCLAGVDDTWARERAAHYRTRLHAALLRVLRDASSGGHDNVMELVITKAFERGVELAPVILAMPNNDYAKSVLRLLQ